MQGNLLAVFYLRLLGNRLLFSKEGPKGKVHFLIVEPSWLILVYKGYNDAFDSEMDRILGYSKGTSA